MNSGTDNLVDCSSPAPQDQSWVSRSCIFMKKKYVFHILKSVYHSNWNLGGCSDTFKISQRLLKIRQKKNSWMHEKNMHGKAHDVAFQIVIIMIW